MGAKLVTTPYEEGKNKTEIPQTQQNEAHKPSQTNSKDFHKHNPHAFMNVDPSSIPSECPMHQAKNPNSKPVETNCKEGDSSCPIKGANDINPLNMVLLFFLLQYTKKNTYNTAPSQLIFFERSKNINCEGAVLHSITGRLFLGFKYKFIKKHVTKN
jgi:hypothetical protein